MFPLIKLGLASSRSKFDRHQIFSVSFISYLAPYRAHLEGHLYSTRGCHRKFPCIMTWWVPFFAQLTRKYQIPREGVICTGNVYHSIICGYSKAFFSNLKFWNSKKFPLHANSSSEASFCWYKTSVYVPVLGQINFLLLSRSTIVCSVAGHLKNGGKWLE